MLRNKNLDKVVAKLFNCKVKDLSKYKIEGLDAYFYWNTNGRGGGQGVFAENGEMLVAPSAVNPDKVVDDFKNGKRN